MDLLQGIAVISLFVVFLISLGTLYTTLKDRRLRQNRKGQSIESFVQYFSSMKIPEKILLQVYSYFQSWANVKDFPVRPEDSLYETYGIVNEDLDEAIFELSKRCECKEPTNTDTEGMKPIETVADVVVFLNKLRVSRSDEF